MSTELLLLYGSILAVVGIVLSKASFRFGLPTLLLFLGVGILAGSFGNIEFDSPETAQAIGTVALTVILFSGGMDTKLSEVRPVMVPGTLLATVGVLLTALLTGTFIYFLFQAIGHVQLTFPQSLLCAAVMSSTDSASVFSILRSKDVHLKHNLKPLLEFESGSNDPMAYMLTVILVSMIQTGNLSVPHGLLMLLMQLTLGVLFGLMFGKGTAWFINKVNLPAGALYPILLLALACFTFAVTTQIGGNGYLAVYLTGLVVGNSKVVHKKSIGRFFDGFQWLCQLIMFLALGLLVNIHDLGVIAIPAMLIALFLLLFGRPISVFLTMVPFYKKFGTKAITYVSWVGLRGAVPIIFACYPWVAGLEYAQLFFNIVFFITLFSLIIQGSTVSLMAEKLDLVDEDVRKKVFSEVDLPEQIKSTISEMVVSASMIQHSNKLMDLPIPDHTLAILVQRDGNFFIPRGGTILAEGDHVLVISDDEDALVQAYEELGVQSYSLDDKDFS